MDMFCEYCIIGIIVNVECCYELVEYSIGLVIVLNLYIGYENFMWIVKIVLESGCGVLELVCEEKLLDEVILVDILLLENMIVLCLILLCV